MRNLEQLLRPEEVDEFPPWKNFNAIDFAHSRFVGYEDAVSECSFLADGAKFIEGSERGKYAFLNGNGFTREGYCQEGISYWNYGYGRFLALGLTVRAATGGKVDFFADPKAKLCFVNALTARVTIEYWLSNKTTQGSKQ